MRGVKVAGAADFRFEEKARFVIRRWQEVTLFPAHACRNASQSKAGSLIAFGRVPPRCRMILGPLGRLTEWMILPALRARTEHAPFRSIPSVVLQPGLSLSAHSARFPGSGLDYDLDGVSRSSRRKTTSSPQPQHIDRARLRLTAKASRRAAVAAFSHPKLARSRGRHSGHTRVRERARATSSPACLIRTDARVRISLAGEHPAAILRRHRPDNAVSRHREARGSAPMVRPDGLAVHSAHQL
jgi:hypothetical protein